VILPVDQDAGALPRPTTQETHPQEAKGENSSGGP